MIEKDRTEEIASTHLGKRVEMCDQYNPNLLVAVPRIDNRRHYNIDNNTLTDYNTKPDYIYLPLSSGYAKFADNYTVEDHSVNLAKSLFRMDGSGYLANGNISWDKDGKLIFGKESESIIIDPTGSVKLGYLHSDESSF